MLFNHVGEAHWVSVKPVTDNNLAVKILEIILILATFFSREWLCYSVSGQFRWEADIKQKWGWALSFRGERSIPSQVLTQGSGLRTNCLCQFWFPGGPEYRKAVLWCNAFWSRRFSRPLQPLFHLAHSLYFTSLAYQSGSTSMPKLVF